MENGKCEMVAQPCKSEHHQDADPPQLLCQTVFATKSTFPLFQDTMAEPLNTFKDLMSFSQIRYIQPFNVAYTRRPYRIFS